MVDVLANSVNSDPTAQDSARSGREHQSVAESSANRNPQDVIAARKRIDLVIRRQEDGRWIVKDPLSLQYSLLDDAEMSVLRSLDGRTTAMAILHKIRTGWPDRDFSLSDIRQLIQQFAASQLITGTNRRESSARPTASVMYWISKLSVVLRMRLPLLTPDPILERLRPLISLFFRPTTTACLALLTIVATAIILVRFGEFLQSLPTGSEFISAENLLGIVLSFVVVKAMHECGHACAAKHYGAECNEAGIWLFLLTPILYTNVTDAWLLNRRQRMIVTAAGMLTEVVIASLSAILWSIVAPGVLRTQLANIVVLCTVSTVLFNGNPLLRYDGYFLVTDAMALPNLAQRSSVKVRDLMERLLFGPQPIFEPAIADQDDQRHRAGTFVLMYGVLSLLYRTIITFGILLLLMRMFDHWNLRILGLGLMAFGVVSMILMPAFQTAISFIATLAGQQNPKRSALRGALIVGTLIGVLFVPIPRSIIVPAVVEPSGIPVFTSLPGEIQKSAAYGTLISQGDTIAELNEPHLQKELLRLRSDVATRELQVRAMELSRDTAIHTLIPEAKKSLEVSRARHARFEEEVQRLLIRAPSDGILLPPRPRPRLNSDDDLPYWTGLPLSSENVGALISEGTLLGYLSSTSSTARDVTESPNDQHERPTNNPIKGMQAGQSSTRRFELLLTLTDQNRRRVVPNQNVEFNLTGNPGVTLRGVVRQVASLQVAEVPEELIAAGLDTDGRQAGATSSIRRWQALVNIVVDDTSESPVLYSTGLARVHIGWSSLASRAYEIAQDTFE